jgi:hypothetical protein
MSIGTWVPVKSHCSDLKISWLTKDLGGYSVGAPPLPIPNREVKPDSADGTAQQCGRVGRRQLSWSPVPVRGPGFLFDTIQHSEGRERKSCVTTNKSRLSH